MEHYHAITLKKATRHTASSEPFLCVKRCQRLNTVTAPVLERPNFKLFAEGCADRPSLSRKHNLLFAMSEPFLYLVARSVKRTMKWRSWVCPRKFDKLRASYTTQASNNGTQEAVLHDGVLLKSNMADKLEAARLGPFSDLKIASHEVLRGLERRPCPKCQASRKYFCYVCYVTVGLDRSLIPTVHLPIKVDIVKHQKELVGKSTATHARILAPGEVTIYNYPEVPKFQENEKVIIVFPSEDAITLEMIRQNHDRQASHLTDTSAVLDRVVFIDSTWQQCHQIITDKKLKEVQKVKLENAVTHFWRPQRKPDTCLATIEAIYYFFKEYDQHILKREYDGRYDNLLYFFSFQYNLIQEEKMKRKKKRKEETSKIKLTKKE